MLSEIIAQIKRKWSREAVLKFLNEVRSLLPPSEDFGISLIKKGVHEYVLDKQGIVIISLNQDEYLPFFAARGKRIDLEKLSDDILLEISKNWRNIISQLRDILLEYGRRDDKYLKVAEEITGIIFENI
ncbi:MAG: hypothetical protein QXV69_04395 [Sulfolobaceae archaeon]